MFHTFIIGKLLKKLFLLEILFGFVFIKDVSSTGPIRLFETDAKKCISKCDSFLLDSVDRIVCFGEANFTGIDARLVSIERKRDTFETLCYIDIKKCDISQPCYCKPMGNDIYEIVVNDTAYIEDSEGSLQASIISRNGPVAFSEIQRLPKILRHDLEIETYFLLVNGREVNNESCEIEISNGHVTLDMRFVCITEQDNENTDNMCYLYVEYNDSKTMYKEQNIKHTPQFQTNDTIHGTRIQFNMKTCRNEKKFSCLLKDENTVSERTTLESTTVKHFTAVKILSQSNILESNTVDLFTEKEEVKDDSTHIIVIVSTLFGMSVIFIFNKYLIEMMKIITVQQMFGHLFNLDKPAKVWLFKYLTIFLSTNYINNYTFL
ncbi:hypothetical protein Btru_072650 [Bulinus truncatus]|nr:hypothetical protein Btru_072650 [Bulinus truncatus]